MRARKNGIDWAVLAYEVMTLMVLHDKFGIDKEEDLKRYCKEMDSIADTIQRDYANLSDFIITLNEECGFNLTEDQLARIDPSLVGLLKPKD